MTVSINFSTLTSDSLCLGKIGEHNATTLTVSASGLDDERIASYRLAFGTGGKSILSESFTEVPFSVQLWKQLTVNPRLSIQLIAYDEDGAYVGKTAKISGFYFMPSVEGAEVTADGSNADLASEILKKQDKLTPGDNITIDDNNKISAVVTTYELPTASAAILGGVKVGDNLSIDENGKLSADAYELPTATAKALGGVIIGDGISVAEDGTISVEGSDSEVFIATKPTTRFAAIKEAYLAGKIVVFEWTDEATTLQTRRHLDMMDYIDLTNNQALCYTMINKQMWTLSVGLSGWGYIATDFYTAEDVTKLLKDKQDVITTTKKLSASLVDGLPTALSQFENDKGFIDSTALEGYATEEWVEGKGYVDNTYHDSTKADVFTIDDTVTETSGNPVSSKAVATYVSQAIASLDTIIGSGVIE